jgi:hypothetical protein
MKKEDWQNPSYGGAKAFHKRVYFYLSRLKSRPEQLSIKQAQIQGGFFVVPHSKWWSSVLYDVTSAAFHIATNSLITNIQSFDCYY